MVRTTPGWSILLAWTSVIFGAGLLFLCSRGDVWLDEIWSTEWADRAGSPWEVLSRFPHDNNHPVNTWWLMIVGTSGSPMAWRALAVLAGVLSIDLVGRLAALIDPAARGLASLLVALSFPLILYFSEARGYGPAVACSLISAMILFRARATFGWIAAFWIVSLLGLLSHATFVMVLLALGTWKTIVEVRSGRHFAELMLWFGVPGLAVTAYFFGFLNRMEIGGGPEYSPATVVGHLFAYALGFPADGIWACIAVGVGIVLGILSWCFGLGRSCVPEIRWFLGLLPLVATGVWLVSRPEVLYFRYFLILLPFGYVALAALLVRLLDVGFRRGCLIVVV